MKDLLEQLKELNDILPKELVEKMSRQNCLLTESVTYRDLRHFVTQLSEVTSNPPLKKLLIELLKSLATLEIRQVVIPQVPFIRTVSPEIFKK